MADNPTDPGTAPRDPDQRRRLSGWRSLRSPRDALQPDAVPEPPPVQLRRRRRPLVGVASGLLSFLGIAAIALAVAWSLGAQRINAAGPLPADKVVTIVPGTDVSAIVEQLASEGVIDSQPLMTVALLAEGNRSSVKAGEYLFKQSASLQDVIDTLVSGKQVLHAVTIPEGLTSEQVVERLKENDILVGDVREVPKEGTLMPDTFKFARGTTREQLVRTMQAEQQRVLKEVWAHRSPDTPIRTSYELVTLASIVEKETGKADERPRVAGVFVNRLARNMPLQSDPTIVYGLVGGKGTLGRGILKSELEQKTPYNTYTIIGLPPGPIANPGRAAMEAVANPSRTRDLYFVADGTGGHAFADSLDQHRQNVQRWRQLEQDAKDKIVPAVDQPVVPAPVPAGNGRPAAAPRGSQRGALDDAGITYGALGATFSNPTAAAPPPAASHNAIPPLASFQDFNPVAATPLSKAPKGVAAYTGDGNFDELDIEVAGVRSKDGLPAANDEGGNMIDGAAAPASGSMATFPVAPARLADQKARALAYGLPSNSDSLPPVAAATDGSPAPQHLFGKGKIIDASEGTSFDPLRDRTYDLNSAKTVPVIKALPPVATMSRVN